MANIVLVEDETLLAEMYQARLASEGYVCHIAPDGEAGWNMIKEKTPDLVLLDIMLPKMSGDEVLAKVRQDEATKHTKVIIMTNINETEAPDQIMLLGFERYIVKANYTLDQVLDVVRETLLSASPKLSTA